MLEYHDADIILRDLNEFIHGANIMPKTPHPITKEKIPLTMGHEISGMITEVGEGVHDIEVGSRIVVDPLIYDNTCFACQQGYINCCENNSHVGLSGKAVLRLGGRLYLNEASGRLGRRAFGFHGTSSRLRLPDPR